MGYISDKGQDISLFSKISGQSMQSSWHFNGYWFLFWARLQNFEKRLLASSYLPVPPSVRLHETTLLQTGLILMKLDF
jgi:hypothetical protein